MNPSTISAEIITVLKGIAGLRVAEPGLAVVPPAAVLGMPGDTEQVTYGTSPLFQIDWPLWILVGKPNERLTLSRLAEWSLTSGAGSIAATLHASTWTAPDYVRVIRTSSEVVDLAGTEYAAVAYTLDVTGR